MVSLLWLLKMVTHHSKTEKTINFFREIQALHGAIFEPDLPFKIASRLQATALVGLDRR
jgi:hypothetical protein